MKPFIAVTRALIVGEDGVLVVKRSDDSHTNPSLWDSRVVR